MEIYLYSVGTICIMRKSMFSLTQEKQIMYHKLKIRLVWGFCPVCHAKGSEDATSAGGERRMDEISSKDVRESGEAPSLR